MLIKVQLTTGYVLELDVQPENTVLDIKQMICDREGVAPPQQKMLLAAQQLANNRTVEELGLRPGTVVQLVLNLRGGGPEGVGRLVPRVHGKSGGETGETGASDVLQRAHCVLEGETHWLANAANLASLMFEDIPRINWAGFYFVENTATHRQLVLGPFAGRVACTRIEFGKGVCGAAAQSLKIQVVHDVHEFPGHIACDSRSASEIVVPLIREGKLVGVLDVDSPEVGRFDGARELFEGLAGLYLESCGEIPEV